MGLTVDKVFSAFIALLIAIFGASGAWQWFRHGALGPAVLLAAAALIGFVCDKIARKKLLPGKPVAAAWLLELWILLPIALGILTVAALIIASVHYKIAEKTGLSKEVAGGVMGAVSTFVSTLFVKAAEDADANWSGAHFKKAFETAYKDQVWKNKADERYVFSDTYGDVKGWGLGARHQRAGHIKDCL